MERVHGFSSQTWSVRRKTRYRELPMLKLGHPGAKTTGSMNTTILWNNITHLTGFEGLKWQKRLLACYLAYATIDVQNSITRAPELGISKLRTFWKDGSIIYKFFLGLEAVWRPQGYGNGRCPKLSRFGGFWPRRRRVVSSAFLASKSNQTNSTVY